MIKKLLWKQGTIYHHWNLTRYSYLNRSDHWEVENNLHWVLDIGFREDDDRKTGNAAINFSAISKLALMLLKQSDIKLGMAGKRKACGWDEKIRDKVIGIEKI